MESSTSGKKRKRGFRRDSPNKMPATMSSQSPLLKSLETSVKDIRDLVTCRICVHLMYEPYTTECGHTFCYTCLVKWFGQRRSNFSCPDCRATVKVQPAPSFAVRDLVHILRTRDELMDEYESMDGHEKLHSEEKKKVDDDRKSKGLFSGYFQQRAPLEEISDAADGVTRCPRCMWELEEDSCGYCGWSSTLNGGLDSAQNSDASQTHFGAFDDSSDESDMSLRPHRYRDPPDRPNLLRDVIPFRSEHDTFYDEDDDDVSSDDDRSAGSLNDFVVDDATQNPSTDSSSESDDDERAGGNNNDRSLATSDPAQFLRNSRSDTDSSSDDTDSDGATRFTDDSEDSLPVRRGQRTIGQPPQPDRNRQGGFASSETGSGPMPGNSRTTINLSDSEDDGPVISRRRRQHIPQPRYHTNGGHTMSAHQHHNGSIPNSTHPKPPLPVQPVTLQHLVSEYSGRSPRSAIPIDSPQSFYRRHGPMRSMRSM